MKALIKSKQIQVALLSTLILVSQFAKATLPTVDVGLKSSQNFYVVDDVYSVSYVQNQIAIRREAVPLSKVIFTDPKLLLRATLEPEKVGHELWGFGAAVTESCLANLDSLSTSERNAAMLKLFDTKTGAGLNFLRIPIGGNDFSLEEYSLDDSAVADPKLHSLNFERMNLLLRFARKAQAINPQTHLILSPWTAPGWMKDTKKLKGGQVIPKYFAAFSKYILAAIKHTQDMGLKVDYVTPLNEPLIGDAISSWGFEQAFMSVNDQVNFIVRYLAPDLRGTGIKILAHDHNWDNAGEFIDKINHNSSLKQSLGGLAYHCYGGTPATLAQTLLKHPGLSGLNTECSAVISDDSSRASDFQWWMQSQSVDATRAGATGGLGWNLCLDPKGGPTTKQGCPNCRGLLTINKDAASLEQKITINPELRALAQVSRYAKVGAKYIASTDLSDQGLFSTSFQNPDGSIVLVLRNPSSEEKMVQVVVADQKVTTVVVPNSGAVTIKLSSFKR